MKRNEIPQKYEYLYVDKAIIGTELQNVVYEFSETSVELSDLRMDNQLNPENR